MSERSDWLQRARAIRQEIEVQAQQELKRRSIFSRHFGDCEKKCLVREQLAIEMGAEPDDRGRGFKNPNDPRIWYNLGQSYGMIINSNLSDTRIIDLKNKVLICYEKAEQEGIQKYLEKEFYHQFKKQIQNLRNELPKS